MQKFFKFDLENNKNLEVTEELTREMFPYILDNQNYKEK